MSVQLFVGLGNPGAGYAGHRHNVGFMAIDAIAETHGFGSERSKFSGLLREGKLGGPGAMTRVVLLKPQTYMNNSGQAVGEAARFFKIEPGDITVFYDELDLAPGKVRVKTGGGLAGHNGLKSLKQHIGAEFRRVRIGIGHPGHKDRVIGHVLSDFAKADRVWLEPLLDGMAKAAPFLSAGDEGRFMSEVALSVQGKLPAPDKNKTTATD